MLTYLKPGDTYLKNDVLEISDGAQPYVVGELPNMVGILPQPGEKVADEEMPFAPRRWSPDPKPEE